MTVTSDVEVIFGRRGGATTPGSCAGDPSAAGPCAEGPSAEGPVLLLRREDQRGLRHAARDFATLPLDALEARWSPRKAMTFVVVASAGLWVVIGCVVFAGFQLLRR